MAPFFVVLHNNIKYLKIGDIKYGIIKSWR